MTYWLCLPLQIDPESEASYIKTLNSAELLTEFCHMTKEIHECPETFIKKILAQWLLSNVKVN
jgi:hypothetical protein